MNEDLRKWVLGIVLLSSIAFWLCFSTIFKFEPMVIYGVISLFAMLLSSFALFKGYKPDTDRRWGLLLIPCIIAVVFIPSPYNIGFILLGIGFFLLAVVPNLFLWLGFAVSGLILAIQAAGMGIYYMLIPSGHSATVMSYIMYPVLKLFGFVTSFERGTIFIQKAGDIFPFPTTWDTLGAFPFILIFLPALVYLLLKSDTVDHALRRAAGFLGLSLVYVVLRYVVLLHFYFTGDLGMEAMAKFRNIFFSSWWLFITFVPFVVLIMLVYSPRIEIVLPSLKIGKKSAAMAVAFLLSAFFFVGATVYQEQGTEKQGRVLVDEIHSTWEPSSLVLDKYWYGSESTYNAYSMIEWFDATFAVDRVMSNAFVNWEPGNNITKAEPDVVSDEITADMLKNYDILILKTPNMYNQSEVAAIVAFVENGGGLFVVGDHSNFAGTSTALNEIIRNFGLEFVFDSANSVEGRLSIYERGKIAHPCAKYMPYFDFLTSCTIAAPINVGRVIPGYALNAEPGEYASTGFFRETRRDLPVLATDRNWGIFHQCVASKYGKGRIVAFADSTCISNFRIFFGGTDGMAIGCMEWLNYSNALSFMTKLFWIAGVVLAGIGVFLFSDVEKKKRLGVFLIVVCAAGLGSSLSIAAFSPTLYDSIPAKYYDWDNTVCFDGSHSSEIVDSGNKEGNYSVFLIWTQRVGRIPSIEHSLQACSEKGKTIIIVDPVTENFSSEDIDILKKHMEKGGNVLMMVDSSTILGLNVIAEFGLEIEDIMKPRDAEEEGPLVAWGPSVKGGEALKTIDDRVVLAQVPYGNGYFLLCTISNVFRNGFNGQPGYMGYNGTDPEALGEEAKELTMIIYNWEYELFEEILA